MALEIVIPGGIISPTTSTAAETLGGGPAVMNPSIVDRSNNFTITTSFSTLGGIFNTWSSPTAVWNAEAIFEQMGGGEFAGTFPGTEVYIQTAALQPYTITITIPSASLPPAGVYRGVLRVWLNLGASPTVVCGFEDLGLVEFYN